MSESAQPRVSASSPPGAASGCFHCGEPLPEPPVHGSVLGTQRDFCCGGCAAAAAIIAEGGLAAYYDKRSLGGLPALAEGQIAQLREQWQALADPEFLRAFATDLGGGLWRTLIAVDGIHCGACVWLIERHLQAIPGVRAAAVNYATRRVLLEWDENRVQLGALLEALARIGYKPSPNVRHASEVQQRRASRVAVLRALVAWLAMMQVMMLAWPAYSDAAHMSAREIAIFQWASLSLTLPTLLFSGWTFLTGSWRDLRARRLGMDVPVVLGLWGAFFASAWAVAQGQGAVYFDSVTMFLALLLSARLIESGLRQRSTNAADELLEQLPAAVRRRNAEGGWDSVAITRLRAGDIVQVPSASLVPVDGEVVDGASSVDEALLTGESEPVAKALGAQVLAGSMNVESPLQVRAAAAGSGTRIAQMVELMNGALADKPRAARLADRAAAWFTLLLLAVAAGTALLWWWLDPARLVPAVIAVLVVSCPCALSLAVPAALAAATARLSRAGVLVARGHALDTLSTLDAWLFDKTGTLTLSDAVQVRDCVPGVEAAQVLAWAAALEQGVQHPLAHALLAAAAQAELPLPQVAQARAQTGRGVVGCVDGRWLRLSAAPETAVAGTLLALTETDAAGGEGRRLALLEVGERLRPGTAQALQALAADGARLELLSGDRPERVRGWADAVGIQAWRAAQLPQDKLERVRALRAQGQRVAMVGDGVNDAPTLGAADVSVSFANAAPIARAGADIVLTFDDMRALPLLVEVARSAQGVMRQNLVWAIGYNAVFIPLAVAGRITPLLAAIGMSVSSLLVVLNSSRLALRRKQEGAWTQR